MRYALTSERMRAAETAADTTLSGLMERAGAALAAEVQRAHPSGSVTIVCGAGNNGGDGWVAARALAEAGRAVQVLALREPDGLAGEAREAAAAASGSVAWQHVSDARTLERAVEGSSVVIDAIFGIGLHGAVREPYRSLIGAIVTCGVPVVSADIPSGLDADTGVAAGPVVRAAVTVTFSALKPGLLMEPGRSLSGRVVVVDIGVPVDGVGALEVPGRCDLRGLMRWPAPEDHKGSRGTVAVVAGSAAYPGAAALAAAGALRMGAGYVHVVTPAPAAGVVRQAWPNAIVRPVAADDDGAIASAVEVLEAVSGADAVVVGPGLTTGTGPAAAVRALIAEAATPLLLDADALNVLTGEVDALRRRNAPTVITPHPGEAGRLLGSDVSAVSHDRLKAVSALSGDRLVCLLKGPGTLIAGGGRSAIVGSGGPGLARAGTGDVLAGMIGTALAQGVDTFDAAVLGAYLHGRAGERGAEDLTDTCLTAVDLPGYIHLAVRELSGG
jgi:NAD(P)H-hydrate epimerase